MAEGTCEARLLAFALRQDNNDIACFALEDLAENDVMVIHGWTSNGYDSIASHDSYCEWLKKRFRL